MKICVIGCGAVGSLFAAHLAKAGEAEVWAYDVWREHTNAIRRNGLKLSGAADFTARLDATTGGPGVPPRRYGIVSAKATPPKKADAPAAAHFAPKKAPSSVPNRVGH